jgi:phenylacetate-coenzyme A ligase PaaK-like adenylate-forming protein
VSESPLRLLLDAYRVRNGGRDAIASRQKSRLSEVVHYARNHSPLFAELYTGLPETIEDVTALPITHKRMLLSRFAEWVTDSSVTPASVRAFVDDPQQVGEKFCGVYTPLTTSGTTGIPGTFLIDSRSFTVAGVLAVRMLREWLRLRDAFHIAIKGARISLICATGGHYAEAVAAARLQQQRGAEKVQLLAAHLPIADMVSHLNAFQPDILAPYASVGVLLANEQKAGRLSIHPSLVVLSAEGLSDAGYQGVGEAFRTPARFSYAATECPFISYSCDEGWLHVNSDWVILEPVDALYRPALPGKMSHTVLVTNLANHIQPILRYDLGDRVVLRAEPCPCGNLLPAIRVEGRAADVLTFPTADGRRTTVPAVMFEVVDARDVALFQVVQTAPTTLRVRLQMAPGAGRDRVWDATEREIRRILEQQSIPNVTIERATEPPQQSPGGKFRTVIPLTDHRHSRGDAAL